MAISNANHQLALVVSSNTPTSYEGLLESQRELLSKQICELQNIVSTQCKLTGVNPLSQEMAAGALSIKIGKRPRDLLNPKAIKYMQSVFSVKDEISKKETRAISALFGLTATQVRDFFTSQRSRVRRFIRLSREKATQSAERVQEQNGSLSSDVNVPDHPVPLNSVGPPSIEAPSCSTQDEVLPDTDDSDKYFIANIFSLLRKEETFSGQVKLMEWILQIQNASVLYWFLTNGGVMILASWLSQAAIEEQTSVLHVILKVLCHLPLHKALPAQMSATLQSVNKLRFYRRSDVSNRAKNLLSRWSKLFARSQAMRKPNANISPVDAQNEMLLKQSIGEILENESFNNPAAICSLQENSETSRSQSIKLLAAPSDDSNMKLLRGHSRERRKVQLVEQPGQKAGGRGPQVTRVFSTSQGRPLSADDIQKAKMRAQFMRSKYGEKSVKTEVPPRVVSQKAAHVFPKVEEHVPAATSSINLSPARPKVEEHAAATSSTITFSPAKPPKVEEERPAKVVVQEAEVEEPVWKKCKRLQISWVNPPEMKMSKEWSVCCGENSKEVDVQNNRIKREKEVFYHKNLEIPPNPKEPWDREMDYDDSLTPEIPTEQPPDEDDNMVTEPPIQTQYDFGTTSYAAGTSTAQPENTNKLGPDLELLAVLLKNPQIVFALTAGQGGSLTNEQMVKLLDAMKANAACGGSIGSLVSGLTESKPEERVEVSLPSPTPSTNPVTSGWRSERYNNQISRQSVTVNGDAYAIPRVNFQETTLLTPPLTQQAIAPITHQRFPDLVPDQRYIPAAVPTQQANSPAMHQRFSDEQRNIPAAVLTQQANSPAMHQRFSDEQRNIPAAVLTQQSISPAMHQRFSDEQRNNPVNTSSSGYYLAGHNGSHLQPPRLDSWTGRESGYSPVEQGSNYNAYGTSTREFVQPGPPWVRNGGYRDRDGRGFESWSPDNSPVRSRDGWDRGYNYRMQHESSRYRDRGGRNDGSRWRDRRR